MGQRAVLARVRLDLGAVQRNPAQLDQLHLAGNQQHLFGDITAAFAQKMLIEQVFDALGDSFHSELLRHTKRN